MDGPKSAACPSSILSHHFCKLEAMRSKVKRQAVVARAFESLDRTQHAKVQMLAARCQYLCLSLGIAEEWTPFFGLPFLPHSLKGENHLALCSDLIFFHLLTFCFSKKKQQKQETRLVLRGIHHCWIFFFSGLQQKAPISIENHGAAGLTMSPACEAPGALGTFRK